MKRKNKEKDWPRLWKEKAKKVEQVQLVLGGGG